VSNPPGGFRLGRPTVEKAIQDFGLVWFRTVSQLDFKNIASTSVLNMPSLPGMFFTPMIGRVWLKQGSGTYTLSFSVICGRGSFPANTNYIQTTTPALATLNNAVLSGVPLNLAALTIQTAVQAQDMAIPGTVALAQAATGGGALTGHVLIAGVIWDGLP
jgi:hypothetical protein